MQSELCCDKCLQYYDAFLLTCPLCPNFSEGVESKAEKSANKCKTCTFVNKTHALICEICSSQIHESQFQIPEYYPQKVKSVVACGSCGLENHLSNSECLSCGADLYQNPQSKKKCPICEFEVKESLYQKHYKDCMLSSEAIMGQVQALKFALCTYCHQKFLHQFLQKHEDKCDKKPKQAIYVPLVEQETRMTKLQVQAMNYMNQKSSKLHQKAKSSLLKKVKGLGFKANDLQNLHFYIQNYAPIIIHIHVSKHMEFFIKDTHYRSQFQTNKSSGSLSRESRTTWQDRMFDKKYSKAKDVQRVKYGTINFTNDPKGVKCCSGYGPSYFLLKPHVRERCTFTDKDSSGSDSVIGTFKYPFHVLDKLSTNQLKAALQGARAMEVSSGCIGTYKEIQIHGPVQFAKDIERIYVNSDQIKSDKKFLDMVYEFSKKNKVDHDFIKSK